MVFCVCGRVSVYAFCLLTPFFSFPLPSLHDTPWTLLQQPTRHKKGKNKYDGNAGVLVAAALRSHSAARSSCFSSS